MAAYYIPSRQYASSSQNIRRNEQPANADALTTIDLHFGEHSIYVFPNPSSSPPSPASSLFSAPTDFDPSSPSSSSSRSRSRPRARLHASSLSVRTNGSRSLSIGQTSTDSAPPSSYFHVERPSTLPSNPESDPDIDEVWDWTRASMSSGEHGSWDLEEEVERMSRWDIDLRLRQLTERTSAHVAHHRTRLTPLRTRTLSQRTTTSASLGSARRVRSPSIPARPSSPQPRIRIPLLSFFAAIFALDLDDPALRLLTQAAPSDAESLLFPGHTAAGLRQSFTEHEHQTDPSSSDSNVGSDYDSDSTTDSGIDTHTHEDLRPDPSPDIHGLQKLLSSTHDPSGAALRSLRAGLAVSKSMPADFGLPGMRGLVGLWRAVGNVYARSGQAWREVWVGA